MTVHVVRFLNTVSQEYYLLATVPVRVLKNQGGGKLPGVTSIF